MVGKCGQRAWKKMSTRRNFVEPKRPTRDDVKHRTLISRKLQMSHTEQTSSLLTLPTVSEIIPEIAFQKRRLVERNFKPKLQDCEAGGRSTWTAHKCVWITLFLIKHSKHENPGWCLGFWCVFFFLLLGTICMNYLVSWKMLQVVFPSVTVRSSHIYWCRPSSQTVTKGFTCPRSTVGRAREISQNPIWRRGGRW